MRETRKIDGEVYIHNDTFRTKEAAHGIAKKMRKRGNKVRTIKDVYGKYLNFVRRAK